MRTALIGYTGFVGGNLLRQTTFDDLYNSRNIPDIRGREFGTLVCAGVSAVKWWANQNPAEDRLKIDHLLQQLGSVRAEQVVLISTIDVYPFASGVDETLDCHASPNHAYGVNRLYFEDAVQSLFKSVTVVRLAGVFGPGLRKNVIFDLLHDNCLENINPESSFQYYNVCKLWADLQLLQETAVRLINFVSEPIRTKDIIERFFPNKSVGSRCGPEAHYDVRTLFGKPWGQHAHYLYSAERVMEDLDAYFQSFRAGATA